MQTPITGHPRSGRRSTCSSVPVAGAGPARLKRARHGAGTSCRGVHAVGGIQPTRRRADPPRAARTKADSSAAPIATASGALMSILPAGTPGRWRITHFESGSSHQLYPDGDLRFQVRQRLRVRASRGHSLWVRTGRERRRGRPGHSGADEPTDRCQESPPCRPPGCLQERRHRSSWTPDAAVPWKRPLQGRDLRARLGSGALGGPGMAAASAGVPRHCDPGVRQAGNGLLAGHVRAAL